MIDEILVKTELFNYREVKPHFINPCCFGEDFAAWILQAVQPLTPEGYKPSDIGQEDYGWGFSVKKERDEFWVAVSYAPEGEVDEDHPTDADGEWHILFEDNLTLNPLKKLFHKPDRSAFERLKNAVQSAIEG